MSAADSNVAIGAVEGWVKAGNGAPFSVPFATGLTPTALRKWRIALARQRLGLGNAVIACIGDSTTVGTGSIVSLGPGLKNGSYPSRLATLLTSAGVTAGAQSCFGDGGYGTSIATYDTRLALGSWGLGSPAGFAGQSFLASAATASPLSFTPVGNTDTCDIFYLTGSSTGSFNANINGGTNTLVSSAGASGYGKLTLTGSLAANVYNVTWASGGNVFIIGFSAYNSAVKQVSVLNQGRGGAKTSEIVAMWQSPAAELTVLSADLAIIKLGINDWLNSISISAFTSSLTTLITSCASVCDVIVETPPYSQTAPVGQAAYTAAMAQVAAANNAVFLNLNGRFGGFANANTDGLMAGDGIHETNYGYMDEAQSIAKLLLAV